jgi:hypothetical protein
MSLLLEKRIDRSSAKRVVLGPEGITNFLPVLMLRRHVKELIVKDLEDGNREVLCGDIEVTQEALEALLLSFGCFTIIKDSEAPQK